MTQQSADKDRDEAPRIGSGYRDWEWAAHRLGEMMCADGPKGYYLFTPQQLVDWASSLPSRTVPEIGALPSSCEGYGVCLRHACLSAGRCTIIGTNNAAQPESTGTVATEGVRPPAAPTGDTPRTDARWNELYDRGGNTITWFEVAERVRDFARQLERELAAEPVSTTQERKA